MKRSPLLTAVAALFACLAAPAFVCAQAEYHVVRTFTPPSVPNFPSSLAEGPDGNFYGTSRRGGVHNAGTVFRLTPEGTVTVLHEFAWDTWGNSPDSLVLGSDGAFYGTTYSTVFRITADGSFTSLHAFTPAEGSPQSAPVQGLNGNFYGTTSGNPGSGGSVFTIAADGKFAILRVFDASYGSKDPHYPGPLVRGADGNFYGVTGAGGSYDGGTFYRMTPAGAMTVLHEFKHSSDDAAPDAGLVLADDGYFYGIRSGWSAPNPEFVRLTSEGGVTVVFSFASDTRPYGLIQGPDGSFYCQSTRPLNTQATLLKIAADLTTATPLHVFDERTEGASSELAFLRPLDGNLYGVAGYYGAADRGTVFIVTPDGDLSVLTAFPGDEQGIGPRGLVRANDGKFYGATMDGGTLNRGTIFSLAAGGEVTWLHSFVEGEGRRPTALIQAADGYLYGTTNPFYCCDRNQTAFRMSTSGAFTVLHEFDIETEGGYPSPLIQGLDGNFYGTTSSGGESGKGTVFRMTPAGVVTVLHVFRDGPGDGAYPSAPLAQGRNGTLYGTTDRGGTTGFGTVFKITTDGSFAVLQSVYAHDGDYSARPMPGVTMASDGNLYGVVPHGKYFNSEMFRLTPDGTYTILFRFGNSGFAPTVPPVQAPDGNLYGVDWPSGYPNPAVEGVYRIVLADGRYETLTIAGDEVYVTSNFVSGGDGYMYGFGKTDAWSLEPGDVFFRLALPMPALMTIDAPGPSPATVAQPFSISGWALDLGPSPSGGSGIDAVHVWALPDSGAAPIFVGAASYGLSRPDVAAAFGSSRFTSSGFGLEVQGLSAGGYRLDAFAHSTRTGTFTVARSVSIVVPAPQMAIDAPVADATLPPAFTLSGWALDPAAASGTGIDAVHVYAYPVSGGAPIFLGVAAYGASRPDVGAIFGARFTNSGFSLAASGLAPGAYRLVVFIHSTASGVFSAQTRDITVRAGNPVMFVDAPATNAVVSPPFTIGGWAVDTDASSGTGVDAIHVWALSSTGVPVFLGAATYGLARPDVGAYVGAARFTNSGYSLSATGLSPGVWQLVIFARSTVTGTFNQARVVSITVN